MSREIPNMNSLDIKGLLKSLTGLDFLHDSNGPENALFTLKAQGIEHLDTPCLEWCVKSSSGILLITEPVTRFSFWQIPEDVGIGNIHLEDVEHQILEDFTGYLESIEQAAYVASSRYGITIKVERSSEPRLFVFVGNNKSEDDFISAVSVLDSLLPQLLATA